MMKYRNRVIGTVLLIAVVIAVGMLSFSEPAAAGVGGNLGFAVCSEDEPVAATSGTVQLTVELTGTSGDFLSGYWFKYKINGIEYRSDLAGSRINQIAVPSF